MLQFVIGIGVLALFLAIIIRQVQKRGCSKTTSVASPGQLLYQCLIDQYPDTSADIPVSHRIHVVVTQ